MQGTEHRQTTTVSYPSNIAQHMIFDHELELILSKNVFGELFLTLLGGAIGAVFSVVGPINVALHDIKNISQYDLVVIVFFFILITGTVISGFLQKSKCNEITALKDEIRNRPRIVISTTLPGHFEAGKQKTVSTSNRNITHSAEYTSSIKISAKGRSL